MTPHNNVIMSFSGLSITMYCQAKYSVSTKFIYFYSVKWNKNPSKESLGKFDVL